MVTKTYVIAKGVRLHYIKTDKFKTNYISINLLAPRSEKLSHYNAMIPMIVSRASKKYPTQAEINKKLQYLYSADIAAVNTTYGEYQIIGLKSNVLNNRFTGELDVHKEILEFLCQLFFEPYLENGVFSKKYVKTEKQNLIDAIESEINNKGAYASKRLLSEMCKDEVYSISKLGKKESVKKITPKSLYNAYKRALKTYPVEIYVVGECDINVAVDKMTEYFGKIDRKPLKIDSVDIKLKADSVKQVADIEKVTQGKLAIGFRTGYDYKENRYYLLQLVNEIFGGSPVSKLFVNVREKMSLCYTCRSSVAQKNGLMVVNSGIEFKNKEIAEKAILDQLEQIKRGEVTSQEFESAKKSLINGFKAIYDSAEVMERWVLYRDLCGLMSTPLEECEKVKNATLEEVQELASRITLDTVYFLKGEESDD